MVYELRIYHVAPGKMDAINRRFADHTLKLFPDHGIKVSQFWVDATGEERLYYVCDFPSREAMAAAWKSFQNDQRWIDVKAKSEVDGKLVDRVESYTMDIAPYFS